MSETTFDKWFVSFLKMKDLDKEGRTSSGMGRDWEFRHSDGSTYWINLGQVIEHINEASPGEQARIKKHLMSVEFAGADIMGYFRHLAKKLSP